MLHLAIDLHQYQITIVLLDDAGDVLQRATVSTKPEQIDEFLASVNARGRDAGGYRAIIEECGFTHWLIDRLKIQLRYREKETLPWDDATSQFSIPVAAGGGSETADTSTDLRTAVQDLPDDQQRVLHGIYQQGKTYQQVADETGLPLGTMKRRLRDALATLRQRLAERVEGS